MPVIFYLWLIPLEYQISYTIWCVIWMSLLERSHVRNSVPKTFGDDLWWWGLWMLITIWVHEGGSLDGDGGFVRRREAWSKGFLCHAVWHSLPCGMTMRRCLPRTSICSWPSQYPKLWMKSNSILLKLPSVEYFVTATENRPTLDYTLTICLDYEYVYDLFPEHREQRGGGDRLL